MITITHARMQRLVGNVKANNARDNGKWLHIPRRMVTDKDICKNANRLSQFRFAGRSWETA